MLRPDEELDVALIRASEINRDHETQARLRPVAIIAKYLEADPGHAVILFMEDEYYIQRGADGVRYWFGLWPAEDPNDAEAAPTAQQAIEMAVISSSQADSVD